MGTHFLGLTAPICATLLVVAAPALAAQPRKPDRPISGSAPVAMPARGSLAVIAVPVGQAPQNVRVLPGGPFIHTLVWDAVPGVSGYTLSRRNATSAPEWTDATKQPILTERFVDTSMVHPGAEYRVTALYADGRRGVTDIAFANPPQPEAPGGLSALRVGVEQVRLFWKPVKNATGYRVFGPGRPTDGTIVNATQFTIGSLATGSYTWTVTADYGVGSYLAANLPAASITLKPVIVGFADTHTHPFANLAAGGALFWGAAFGPEAAVMALCTPIHGFAGLSDLIGTIERDMNRSIQLGHKTGGYPNYDGWPKWNTLDHQQMYSDWILRAHEGGLRLMVALAINNGLLCELSKKAPGRTCDDMEAADLQIAEAKKMENFIDMQSGGPGRGWFRIAYTPEQARQIIADGKLAVVLGIEVDKLFSCGKNQCDPTTVDAKLAQYYQMGVRHLIPVHFADNAFGGFALMGSAVEKEMFIANSRATNQGGLVGGASVLEEPCAGYGQKCNQRGLTPLGEHLITSMMNRGMIIDVDHMSKHSADGLFALTSAREYPVLSGHTNFVQTSVGTHKSEREKSESQVVALKKDGGMVSVVMKPGETDSYTPSWRGPIANDCIRTSKSWVQAYLYAVDRMGGPDVAAVGLATDQFLNPQMGPRFDNHCQNQQNIVAYPLLPRPGSGRPVLINQRSGNRTFDYNSEGLAQVGLLPDFVQDLKNIGLTDRDLNPLYRSAEGYIELWERAVARSVLP